ncbi:MAG: alpha-mannosidase, partial [Caldilineaceae bacterium]|nr:alpha-mannosidase [Caldilineaceae bacterium]
HRGTYTTHGAVKAGNRELERLLFEAELWSLAAHRLTGAPVPADVLDASWKVLLLHQFHDIIPGSSIHWVYDDTLADYDRLRTEVGAVRDVALGALAEHVDAGGATRPALVANGLPFARDELVDHDGTLVRATAPACGWEVVDLDRPVDELGPPVTSGHGWMDNGIIRVEWDGDGLLRSIVHHPTGREVVAEGAAANLLQLFDDEPADWDAWDIDAAALATGVDLTEAEVVELVEQHEDRATLLVARSFGRSRIEQRVRLARGSRRLEVHCEVDWHEDHKLLKVAFPLRVHTSVARHEIQFGHVDRPTHRNTSWDQARFETCAHTWVDLSEDSFGVALLNDSKYGHKVKGHTIDLNLLRSVPYPGPRLVADDAVAPGEPHPAYTDQADHAFRYALYPHAGDGLDAGVVRTAYEFNIPLQVVDATSHAGTMPPVESWLAVDRPEVVIETVKLAEQGDGLIVRAYETTGATVTAHVSAGIAVTGAEETDLLERSERAMDIADGTLPVDFRPFEIKTLRLR